MSIARTLEGRLSATLALIAIIGWIVVAIVEAYPMARPDNATVIMVVSLAVVAFKFYQLDRASGKDPVTQKAQLDAAVEIFLEKLAKHRALAGQMSEGEDNPLIDLIRLLEKIGKEATDARADYEAEKSEDPELPKTITDDREEEESKDGGPW